jgi:nucleoside triphosphate pyrophosphatase
VEFEVRPVDVEEREHGPPDAVASWNAERKAQTAGGQGLPEGGVALGADTVVALDGHLYGKPGDEEQARATLEALSARTHEVVTAVVLWTPGSARGAAVHTRVTFREIDSPLMEWYLAGGEWRDRAGGYAIQGRGAALVDAIQGDFFNVVGLPVAALLDLAPELLG